MLPHLAVAALLVRNANLREIKLIWLDQIHLASLKVLGDSSALIILLLSLLAVIFLVGLEFIPPDTISS